jgi:hypothetical protein
MVTAVVLLFDDSSNKLFNKPFIVLPLPPEIIFSASARWIVKGNPVNKCLRFD